MKYIRVHQLLYLYRVIVNYVKCFFIQTVLTYHCTRMFAKMEMNFLVDLVTSPTYFVKSTSYSQYM